MSEVKDINTLVGEELQRINEDEKKQLRQGYEIVARMIFWATIFHNTIGKDPDVREYVALAVSSLLEDENACKPAVTH